MLVSPPFRVLISEDPQNFLAVQRTRTCSLVPRAPYPANSSVAYPSFRAWTYGRSSLAGRHGLHVSCCPLQWTSVTSAAGLVCVHKSDSSYFQCVFRFLRNVDGRKLELYKNLCRCTLTQRASFILSEYNIFFLVKQEFKLT